MPDPIAEYTPSTTRIEAFSDAVFAIVVTLLVLELHVPKLPEGFTERQMLGELWRLAPNFFGFLVSFFVLAIFWVNHHQFFHSLRSASRGLLWHNNHLLFWLCFVPFPTAFVGEYHTSRMPVMLYAFMLGMAGIAFNLMVRHAAKRNLFHPEIPDAYLRRAMRRGIFGPVLYFGAMALALVSVEAALALFAVVPVLYFIPQKILRSGGDGTE